MLIVSNHIKGQLNLRKEVVIRINMAWVKTINELYQIIELNWEHDIYLDFPQGRTKPPKPILTLTDAFDVMSKYKNIKYFAISNVEEESHIKRLRETILPSIKLIPKIESEKGVNNLLSIITGASTDTFMFDKEDLYSDVGMNAEKFGMLVDKARSISKENGITILELQGVIFDEYK